MRCLGVPVVRLVACTLPLASITALALATASAALAIDGRSDATPLAPPQVWLEVAKLVSPGDPADHFGESSAIDGDRLVVGEPDPGNGRVHLFERDPTGAWVPTALLTASDGVDENAFGDRVAIRGDLIVVGDRLVDDAGEDAGAAYVFERDAEGWHEVAKLVPASLESLDGFGGEVAAGAETIAVAAWGDDDAGFWAGAVYLFERGPDGAWAESTKLLASDGKAYDLFGSSIALDGATLAVGAENADDRGSASGALYLFERDPLGTWSEAAKLAAPDSAAGDHLGLSIAIRDGLVIAGALGDDGGTNAGSAHLFERGPSGTWSQVARLVAVEAAPEDEFGWSVAVDGATIVVGAHEDDYELETNAGSAYLFERAPDGTWVETSNLAASDFDDGDRFTESMALDADTLLVGAPYDEGQNDGAAYVFERQRPCDLRLELEPATGRAGDLLDLSVRLAHRRSETVTRPFRVSIVDAAGHTVFDRWTAPRTFDFGDRFARTLRLRVPPNLDPGDYEIVVSVDAMSQGAAVASTPLFVQSR